MKTALPILVSLMSCVICKADPVPFPTEAGVYTHKGWRYVYEVKLKGTRAEKRIGRLFLNGKEIKGKIGELQQEPIGIFIYFGERGYNQGWLNTMTYDEAVFSEDGAPTDQVTALLKALRDNETKAEQGGAGQPATRPESDSEGGDKPQPESEGRSR
ncbi:hypothetical protein JIN85_21035 [Luteolibacter pohnpeiensis]|uniref:Uncharacterized protein n=2 Tax=Luteolibacter pohnpeiensis TaxID=454153 RepID=A0A934SBK4_9BACT|nr:hypothetical protein [Luteolibacter pohnpeiensis]